MASKQKGMTLIEVIATLSLMSVILTVLFSFQLLLLKQENRTFHLNSAKRNVMLVNDILSSTIRNSNNIETDFNPSSPNSSFTITTDSRVFTFSYSSTNIPNWTVTYYNTSNTSTIYSLASLDGVFVEQVPGGPYDPNNFPSPPYMNNSGKPDRMIITLWKTYTDDNNQTQRFVITSGFYTNLAQ